MILTSTYDGNGGSTIKALPKTKDIPSALYVLAENATDTFRKLSVKGKSKVRPRYRHDGAHAGRKAGRTAAERYATLLRDGVEYDCIVAHDRLCPHHADEIAKSLRNDSSLKIRHIYLAPDSSLSTVSMYVVVRARCSSAKRETGFEREAREFQLFSHLLLTSPTHPQRNHSKSKRSNAKRRGV